MSDETYMRTIDLRGKNLTRAQMLDAMPRAEMGTDEATELVQPILDNVRANGAKALREYAEKFDHVVPKKLRVPSDVMDAAVAELDDDVKAAIEESIRCARAVAASQVPEDFHTDLADGARVSERWIPVQRVGLYVPGGKAVYPSSVIMNAVPAQAAGVESLAIATPPNRNDPDGWPNKTILATCAMLGVDEVYAVGGAQAIAMFAYGATDVDDPQSPVLCEPVDKITGPGNIFVATAKRLVSGIVGIDAVAGPTEIAIIADKDANPEYVAADLIGQAEHDELAGSVLITDSLELADAVQTSLLRRVPRTEHAERVETSLKGRQSGIILTDSLEQSIDAANAYAAEHLEVQTADPDAVIVKIRNAGAIFRGPYSPVPLGDYMSGSNHVLPTSGTARFASGLGVHTFMKPVEVIEYDEEGLKPIASRINAFAVSEDLPAHGESVLTRFVEDPYDKDTLDEQQRKAALK
ncbi:MAG: histidinol dehydrogenase [Bifidobacterium sp.]|nr:histidinol dehydrogenase [Bifidobacterium sp.]